MWVEMQVLTPGVQYREEPDGCAQQPGVGGGFEQSARGGVKQDGVNRLGVLQRQPADLLREREYHVEIGDG